MNSTNTGTSKMRKMVILLARVIATIANVVARFSVREATQAKACDYTSFTRHLQRAIEARQHTFLSENRQHVIKTRPNRLARHSDAAGVNQHARFHAEFSRQTFQRLFQRVVLES